MNYIQRVAPRFGRAFSFMSIKASSDYRLTLAFTGWRRFLVIPCLQDDHIGVTA
jgi:hypothetical protein